MVDTRNEKAGVRTAVADRDDNTQKKSQEQAKKRRTLEGGLLTFKRREAERMFRVIAHHRKISRISIRSRTKTLRWRRQRCLFFISSTRRRTTTIDRSIKATQFHSCEID